MRIRRQKTLKNFSLKLKSIADVSFLSVAIFNFQTPCYLMEPQVSAQTLDFVKI